VASSSDTEIVIIGGGAAGIAAARRIADARLDCLLVEARSRLGGRAWTINSEFPIDLGCGWLHSADRNPWREAAEVQGRSIDKTPPPWMRRSAPIGFPLSEQDAFLRARRQFHEQLGSLPEDKPDVAAATFLEPRGRWNALINALSTYGSGAELDRVSARDLDRYGDAASTGGLWRATER
jgi:monoamine oxidase